MPKRFISLCQHSLPFDSSELTTIMEAARYSFSHSDIDSLCDHLDLDYSELQPLRERLGKYMDREEPPYVMGPVIQGIPATGPANPMNGSESQQFANLVCAANDLLASLEWITRCAKMPGPCGTTVYFINDATMARANAAVAKAKSAK